MFFCLKAKKLAFKIKTVFFKDRTKWVLLTEKNTADYLQLQRSVFNGLEWAHSKPPPIQCTGTGFLHKCFEINETFVLETVVPCTRFLQTKKILFELSYLPVQTCRGGMKI